MTSNVFSRNNVRGGGLTATSVEGSGSDFALHLPVAGASRTDASAAEEPRT